MKFGVCTIVKNENLYLREWVEHYISIGFDKIIIYDHNSENGEIPNSVIQDYIDKNIVDVINYRNDSKDLNIQVNAYNNCLKNYSNTLDWIGFFDADEFLYFEKYKTIQDIFAYMPYNNFNEIIINLYYIGDDGQMYYENKPVQERFKKHVKGFDGTLDDVNQIFKCMVKTSANSTFTSFPHTTNAMQGTKCNVDGSISYAQDYNIAMFIIPIHRIMYLKHYYTKSLTEFLYRRLLYDWYNKPEHYMQVYKNLNGWTEEHEKVYQEFIKQNNINI